MDHQRRSQFPGFGNKRLVAALGLAAGCLIGSGSLHAQDPDPDTINTGSEVEIKVYFEGKCPRYVDNALAAMDEGSAKRLMWVAYDSATGQQKTDAQYSVYFDPFKGKTDDSNKQGVVKSKKLEDNIPANVLFKYTIVGTADDLPANCEPLDPFFRVR